LINCEKRGAPESRQLSGAEPVRPMMYANLLEFVRRFAPVGSRQEVLPQRRTEGYALAMEQLDRMALWLERNSSQFRDPAERAELRKLREKYGDPDLPKKVG